jgi:hypothetical protein
VNRLEPNRRRFTSPEKIADALARFASEHAAELRYVTRENKLVRSMSGSVSENWEDR